MTKTEEIMELAVYYAECRIGVYLNPHGCKDSDDLDKSVAALKSAIEELVADAEYGRSMRLEATAMKEPTTWALAEEADNGGQP